MSDGRKDLEEILSWLSNQDFKHDFVRDGLAPAVDEELIKKFVSGDLEQETHDETLSLIMTYRTWFEFCLQTIRDS